MPDTKFHSMESMDQKTLISELVMAIANDDTAFAEAAETINSARRRGVFGKVIFNYSENAQRDQEDIKN